MRFYVGLDLGQLSDYTAVVVAEKVPLESLDDYELHIRHLERFRDVLYPDRTSSSGYGGLSTLPSCTARRP